MFSNKRISQFQLVFRRERNSEHVMSTKVKKLLETSIRMKKMLTELTATQQQDGKSWKP